MHYSPLEGSGLSDRYSVAMDLTQPAVQPFYGIPGGAVQISTLTVAHNLLVAGGFCGEYGVTNLRAHKKSKHAEGIITDDANAITNHIQVHLSRGSSLPLAAFASNDKGVRILDVNTNTFIADHKYEHAMNCSAISPDQRLRILTGDTRKVLICNAETGEILQELEGHRDFGFACDWADNGWTVATGNQDMQVLIWDARKWKNSQGIASPIATIAAEMAGVRKLKFSPVGSGKRVLIAAEPADFVSVIDVETFSSKQTLSFFGEIGGLDFANNGQDLIIANCDSMRGGMMEFERCGLANRASYELDEPWNAKRTGRKESYGYDWMINDDDTVRHPRSRGSKTQRTRKPAMTTTATAAF
jgi:WD40 repeat protein